MVRDLHLDGLPVLLVLNKVDQAEAGALDALVRDTGGIPVSALRRTGLDELMVRVENQLWRQGRGDVRPLWLQEQERWAQQAEEQSAES